MGGDSQHETQKDQLIRPRLWIKKCFITPQKFSQVATSLMSKLQASVCLIHSTLSLWLSDDGIGVSHISRKDIPGCLKVRTVFLLNTRKYSLRSLAHTCPATNAIASGNVYTVGMAVKCNRDFSQFYMFTMNFIRFYSAHWQTQSMAELSILKDWNYILIYDPYTTLTEYHSSFHLVKAFLSIFSKCCTLLRLMQVYICIHTQRELFLVSFWVLLISCSTTISRLINFPENFILFSFKT